MRQKNISFSIFLGAILIAVFLSTAPFQTSAVELLPIIKCAVHTGAPGDRIPGMLSPMTDICSICDLLVLLQTGFNFVWLYLTIPIAAAMFLYGGFLMVLPSFTGNANQATKGRSVLLHTVLGLAIVFFAWIGVDSVLKIMGAQFGTGSIKQLGPWNEIVCDEEAARIRTIAGPVDVIPVELACPPGVTERWVDGSDVCNQAVQRAIVTHTSERGFGTSPGTWGSGPECTPAAANVYNNTVQSVASETGISPNRIKAIILKESSGNPNLPGPVGEIGLMQLRPGTAREAVPELRGKSLQEVSTWLRDPKDNYRNNIRAGSLFYASVLQKQNGNHDRAARGYNGGAAANLPSRDCPGLTRSECQWDNPEHTIWNTGYGGTRVYASWVNNCQAKF